MAELKPCPVCGRKPKIHYYTVNLGWAECKPIFRKPHLMSVVAWAPPSRLEEAIIEAWNRRANND